MARDHHRRDDDAPIIRVRGLKNAFGDAIIHENLDLEVRRGEILGLIGPNGAGKTTCFNVMTGVYQASTWTAIVSATGVILSAMYALTLYRRVMYGEIVNPELKTITDLDAREILLFVPLIIMTLVLGIYPNLVFNLTASSVDALVGAWRAAVGG